MVSGVNSETGELNYLDGINPVRSTNIQAEKDAAALIYEPLFTYGFEVDEAGKILEGINNVLASEVFQVRPGGHYLITLKDNVLWHDGRELTVEDVFATFELIKKYDTQSSTGQALSNMNWVKISDNSFRICTKPGSLTITCNQEEENPLISNFLELISVNIVPEHLTFDIDSNAYNSSGSELFRSPVGTGPYKFAGIRTNKIIFDQNLQYHDSDKISKIDRIIFNLYESTDLAIQGLRSGEIHSFATFSTKYSEDTQDYSNIISSYESEVGHSQFWGLLFQFKRVSSFARLSQRHKSKTGYEFRYR